MLESLVALILVGWSSSKFLPSTPIIKKIVPYPTHKILQMSANLLHRTNLIAVFVVVVLHIFSEALCSRRL